MQIIQGMSFLFSTSIYQSINELLIFGPFGIPLLAMRKACRDREKKKPRRKRTGIVIGSAGETRGCTAVHKKKARVSRFSGMWFELLFRTINGQMGWSNSRNWFTLKNPAPGAFFGLSFCPEAFLSARFRTQKLHLWSVEHEKASLRWRMWLSRFLRLSNKSTYYCCSSLQNSNVRLDFRTGLQILIIKAGLDCLESFNWIGSL